MRRSAKQERRFGVLRPFMASTPVFTPAYTQMDAPEMLWSRDFFRFAIFLRYTGPPAGSCPPLCAFNLSKRWRWAQGRTFDEGTQSSPRSCCRGEKKVQECPLTRAPSTRLSSPWWEPLRPWSSAVTSPAPSSDITPAGVTRELTDGHASLTRCVIRVAIFLHSVILGTFLVMSALETVTAHSHLSGMRGRGGGGGGGADVELPTTSSPPRC